ncbi:MAG: hypothetical protein ACLFR7_10955, partial [Opitutales bacterium]
MILLGGFVVLVLLFLVGMWQLARLGPAGSRGTAAVEQAALTEAEARALQAEVTELRRQFTTAIEDGEVSLADLQILELAIRQQRRLLEGQPYAETLDLERLAELEETYDDHAGGVLHVRSIAAEATARAAAEEGRVEEALAAFAEAIALQEQINQLYSRGNRRDLSRPRRLEMERQNLLAAPLAREAAEHVQEAEVLLEEQHYLEAAERLRAAVELHDRLQREFGNTRHANRTEHRRVQSLLVDTEAAELREQRAFLRAEAEVLLAAGAYEQATGRLERAMEVQRDLAARFPRSSYADPGVMRELQADRQSALSARLEESIVDKVERLRRLLRERRASTAAPLAADAYRDLRQLHESFSASRFLNEERLLEINYLNL